MPSTDVIQLILPLKTTTAQVVETSVTVNNSPIQDYTLPHNPIQPTDKKKIIHKFLSSFSNINLILTFCCSDSCTRMLLQLRTFSLTHKMLQDHRDLGVKDKVITVQYQYCSKTILSAELIVSLEESFQFFN